MTRISWTPEAVETLDELGDRDQERLLHRLDLIEQFPEMYPTRQKGRYVGLRYFLLADRWVVHYRVEADRAVLVFNIVPARVPS